MFEVDSHAYLPIEDTPYATPAPATKEKDYYQADLSGHELKISLDQHDNRTKQLQTKYGQRLSPSSTSELISITEENDAEKDILFQEQKKYLSTAYKQRVQTGSLAEASRDNLLKAMMALHEAKEKFTVAKKTLEEAADADLASLPSPLHSKLTSSEEELELPDAKKEYNRLFAKVKIEGSLKPYQKKIDDAEKKIIALTSDFEKAKQQAAKTSATETQVAHTIIQTASEGDRKLSSYWRELKTQAKKSLEMADEFHSYQKPLIIRRPIPEQALLPDENTPLLVKKKS